MRHVVMTLGWVLAWAAPPALADQILLHDGTLHQGVQVTSESLAEVKFTKGGEAQSIAPGTRVKNILRDKMPEGLDNGFGFLNAGQPQKAIDEFTSQAASGSGWVVEYACFGLGQAKMALGQRGGGDAMYTSAIESFDKLLVTNSQSRFAIDAGLLKGTCYRLLKQYAQAISAYDQAKAAAGAVGDGWPERAAVGAGWTHLEAGRAAEAKAVFEAAASGASSFPAVRREALVGWIEAASAAGCAPEIPGKMQGLQAGADRATLGVVHAGLGVALFAEKQYAQARLELVQTVSIYASDPNAHALALYFAGQCYKALGEDDYPPIYWRELRDRYPLSTWALRLK